MWKEISESQKEREPRSHGSSSAPSKKQVSWTQNRKQQKLKMALSVPWLLYSGWGLGSIPITQITIQVWQCLLVNPSTGEEGTGGCPDFLATQPSLLGEYKVQQKSPSKKTRRTTPEEWQQGYPLASMSTPIHIKTHMYPHPHKNTQATPAAKQDEKGCWILGTARKTEMISRNHFSLSH